MTSPNDARDLEPKRDANRETALSRRLGACRIGQPIQAFERVNSTMTMAHELAAGGAAEGTVVWAAEQTQGRGRLGRTWTSPQGGVYLSLILRPTRPPAEIPQLSLVAGLATAQAIQELTGLFPTIRWPNDLLLNGKKVCGILVEAKDRAVVVGIGINVTIDPRELPDHATSLAAAGATDCDLYRLTGLLCRRFEAWHDEWTRQGFPLIREALRPWLGHLGQPVHITAGSSQFEGIASDLDEQGRLLVRLDAGMLKPFEVGEVTLLRVDG